MPPSTKTQQACVSLLAVGALAMVRHLWWSLLKAGNFLLPPGLLLKLLLLVLAPLFEALPVASLLLVI
jgi:hypothetical protein